MTATEITDGSTVVIDSSVLFAMGGPSNEKYRAFERYAQHRNLTVVVPRHVAQELGESPDSYAYQRDRLRAAQESGWLEPGEIDFSVPDVSTVVDRTRRRMAALSAADVSEDEIERTDTILAGIAYQFATDPNTNVAVLVSDVVAERAIADVLRSTDAAGRTQVIEGRSFLRDLVH